MELTDKFDWGESSQEFINGVTLEIFKEQDYDWLYPVQEGDVVMDLGASVGPFTWKIMDKASKVYSFEPMPNTYPVLEKNVKGYPVEVIKKALYHTTGTYKFPLEGGLGDPCGTMSDEEMARVKKEGIAVDTISFQDFLKEYNVDKIDFIKTDCEGGEYSLFKDENLHFLKNNVRNIVGEWHLMGEHQETEFRYFRDKYLKHHFPNHKIYSLTWDIGRGPEVTWSLWKDEPYDSVNAKNLPPFIDYYKLLYVYISNEP